MTIASTDCPVVGVEFGRQRIGAKPLDLLRPPLPQPGERKPEPHHVKGRALVLVLLVEMVDHPLNAASG